MFQRWVVISCRLSLTSIRNGSMFFSKSHFSTPSLSLPLYPKPENKHPAVKSSYPEGLFQNIQTNIIHMYMHSCTSTNVHMNRHRHTHTHMYTCTNNHTHTHMQEHAHTLEIEARSKAPLTSDFRQRPCQRRRKKELQTLSKGPCKVVFSTEAHRGHHCERNSLYQGLRQEGLVALAR